MLAAYSTVLIGVLLVAAVVALAVAIVVRVVAGLARRRREEAVLALLDAEVTAGTYDPSYSVRSTPVAVVSR